MTTIINPFAGLGGTTEEIDTRTVDIPAVVITSLDNAVAHFNVRQNKKQLRNTQPTEEAAQKLASQISRYAAANGVTVSTLDQDGTIVTFRFAKVRLPGEAPDPEDDYTAGADTAS